MFHKTIVMVVALLWARSAFAAHPLITDDAGTQGKGKFQIELNGKYELVHEGGIGAFMKRTASALRSSKNLKAVANVGMEKNPDRTSSTHPSFILGGLICSLRESFDIDAGVKAGLNKAETDYTLLAGLTYRF